MRFDNEYQKEMNNKKLSDDFIKNLAVRMTEESEKSADSKTKNAHDINKEIETRVIEYKETKKMTVIKISALAASAAAVIIAFGSVLNNIKTEENIHIDPGTSDIVTSISETERVTEITTVSTADTEITRTTETSVAPAVTSASASENEESVQTTIPEVTSYTYESSSEETTSVTELPDEYFTQNAYEIFDAVHLTNCLTIGGRIETDNTVSFTEHIINHETGNEYDAEYILVTDNRFSGINDINEYLHKYFTDSFIENNLYSILDYRFTERDGKLYVTITPTSCGYDWSSDDITISEKSENSFVMTRPYHDFGVVSILKLHLVKSDSQPGWKINAVENIYPEMKN